MSIRLGSRFHNFVSPVMFSRCFSSLYRSVRAHKSFLSIRKYHLLSNTETPQPGKLALSNIIREITHTFGLSLFLFYLFYQLFGNFILIICLVCGILCKLFAFSSEEWTSHVDSIRSTLIDSVISFSFALRPPRCFTLSTDWARYFSNDRSNSWSVPSALRAHQHWNIGSGEATRISDQAKSSSQWMRDIGILSRQCRKYRSSVGSSREWIQFFLWECPVDFVVSSVCRMFTYSIERAISTFFSSIIVATDDQRVFLLKRVFTPTVKLSMTTCVDELISTKRKSFFSVAHSVVPLLCIWVRTSDFGMSLEENCSLFQRLTLLKPKPVHRCIVWY